MSAEPKPSELAERFRSATRGQQRKGVDAPRADAVQAEEAPAPPLQAPLPLPHVPPPRRVRFTLDLARDQHRFLKRFALDEEADASEVVRALLAILERDDQVATAVRFRLAAARQ